MNVFVQPVRDADGNAMLVRDPHSRQPLKPEGEWKPKSTFWIRRLRDGDVIEVEPTVQVIVGQSGGKSDVVLSIEIPAAWRDLHHTQRVNLAESLNGDFIVPDGKTRAQAADAAIEAELARRAAALQS
jgi:hypothetical protein